MAVFMWLSVWMLAIPLFHVHPEADHHHGVAGHVHGGTVHTVLSGDLDCEFGSHEKATPPAVALSEHFPHAGHEHPELGFSLLNDSNDRKSFKPLGTQAPFAAIAVMPVLQGCDSVIQDLTSDPSATLFVHDRPSRAPPFLLV
ncbi:MAG: hypothetical protein HY038_02410 [Nitrospirae bacterium]|nr:hypothetical protein [Nitrospirota bacterium]